MSFRAGETGIRALDDRGAFELGEYAHHLEHRLARRRGRVDPLLMQIEIGVFRVQLAQERHKVLQRSAQAIDGSDRHLAEQFPNR